MLVVEVRLNVNLASLTFEQVVGQRLDLLVTMGDRMAIEVRKGLPKEAADVVEAEVRRTIKEVVLKEGVPADHYNADEAFEEAVKGALAAKRGVAVAEKLKGERVDLRGVALTGLWCGTSVSQTATRWSATTPSWTSSA